ncbi:MAG: alanine racemase [Clostridia bacterium]|nr:alanine racemase [Clostridia bacterium]
MKTLIIEKEKLEENIRKIKDIIEKNNEEVKIIAVVKCNGYGLGAVEYTKYLIENGIEIFAVSSAEEAIQLREAGIEKEILMLSGIAIKEEVEKLVENDITLTITSKEDIEIIESIAEEKDLQIRVHLKIDTGMGRYGFVYNETEKLVEALKSTKQIKIEGTYSHFSNSYYDKKYTEEQYRRFTKTIEILKENNIETGMLHICNSSAFIKYSNMYLDAVRIGSAFLGRLSCKSDIKLNSIGYLETRVAEIKEIEKGSYVSYSNSYKTKKNTKIAIVPCGYDDGFNITTGKDMFRNIDKFRNISRAIKDLFKKEKILIKINNENCEVLGRVGTHHIVCDITDKDISIGDKVILKINPKYVDSSTNREFR